MTVRPGNALGDISMVPERVRRHDGDSLAALLLDTIERASAQLVGELTERTADLVPDGFDVAAAVSGSGLSRLQEDAEDARNGNVPGPDEDPPAEENLGIEDLPGDVPFSDAMSEELQRARSLLSGVREQVERQQAAYRDLRAQLPDLRGHASALEGLVEVRVREGNAISELHIADRALQMPKRLGPAVLRAIQQAQGDLASQIAARLGTAVPSIDLASMVAEHRRRDDEADEAPDPGRE